MPASGWLAETAPANASAAGATTASEAGPADVFWQSVAAQVRDLQPGTIGEIDASSVAFTQLPAAAFRAWRGNVIRLDDATGTMPDDATLRRCV